MGHFTDSWLPIAKAMYSVVERELDAPNSGDNGTYYAKWTVRGRACQLKVFAVGLVRVDDSGAGGGTILFSVASMDRVQDAIDLFKRMKEHNTAIF